MYSDLIVKKSGRHHWRLVKDWITPYAIIPKGFETDGASVPRLLWPVFSPSGVLFEAAVLHDYLYKNAIESKSYADNAFKETSLYYKATKLESYAAYFFVKIFGNGNY